MKTKLFQKKWFQFILYIMLSLFLIYLLNEYSKYNKKRIILKGQKTEAEVKKIIWRKRGYYAVCWFFDTKMNKCVIDLVLLDEKESKNIKVNDRYITYYISGGDNLVFLDSPLLTIRDNELYINEEYYKNDTIIESICPSEVEFW